MAYGIQEQLGEQQSGSKKGKAYNFTPGVSFGQEPDTAAPGDVAPAKQKTQAGAGVAARESYEDTLRKVAASRRAVRGARAAESQAFMAADQYRPYVAGLESDLAGAPGRHQQAASRALAPLAGQYGIGGYGASAAGALTASQLSQDAEMASAAALRQLQADLLEGRVGHREALIAAEDLGIQASQLEMEAPTMSDWRAQRRAELAGHWKSAVKGAKSNNIFTGGDDESAMFRNMHEVLKDEPDEALKLEFYRKACAVIDSDDYGADICRDMGIPMDLVDA